MNYCYVHKVEKRIETAACRSTVGKIYFFFSVTFLSFRSFSCACVHTLASEWASTHVRSMQIIALFDP